MTIGEIKTGQKPPRFVAHKGKNAEVFTRIDMLKPGQWFEWDLADRITDDGRESSVMSYALGNLHKALKRCGLDERIDAYRSGPTSIIIYDVRLSPPDIAPAAPILAQPRQPAPPSPALLQKQAEVERSEAAVAAQERRPPGRPRKDGLPPGSVPKKPPATPIPPSPPAAWKYPGQLKPPPADPRLRDLGSTLASSRQEPT